jgi:type VI secretion system protein ImpF
MARRTASHRIQHSLWERLTNPDLLRGQQAGVSASGEVERLKTEVGRDLEGLLNTRTAPLDIPEGYADLEHSLVRFGLPDFSSMRSGDPKARERLEGMIKSAIQNFEPRLLEDSVEVEAVESEKDRSRSRLHFSIRGKLRVDPVPQPVQFETVLELMNRSFVVERPGGQAGEPTSVPSPSGPEARQA